ncbi:ABC transporter permease [Rhizomonospora bruguierae]|uniref:ABC transporter permease n=1 Tax=Rhizomonospora bruguierae TaxID=1581705 RepID=UPI001BCC58E4|nr:ABC transporter permease [Micromonospora sp. NBRC 107566]
MTTLQAPAPAPAARRRTVRRSAGSARRRGDPRYVIAAAVVFVLLWQLVVVFGSVPGYMLPAPMDVAKALWHGMTVAPSDRDSYLPHLWHTTSAALAGFALGSGAGIVLGGLCAMNRVVNQVVRPYVFGLQSMPKVALTPLLMVWLGFGNPTKITLAALLVFFPVFVNAYTGLVNVDDTYLRLFRGMSASRWQMLSQLRLPAAMVAVFAGLEMGIVRAQLGAVVAEFLAGQNGLGIILIRFQYVNDTAGAFAVFILLAISSFVLYRVLKASRKRVIFWIPSHTDKR